LLLEYPECPGYLVRLGFPLLPDLLGILEYLEYLANQLDLGRLAILAHPEIPGFLAHQYYLGCLATLANPDHPLVPECLEYPGYLECLAVQ
jgi:hypothetical protein